MHHVTFSHIENNHNNSFRQIANFHLCFLQQNLFSHHFGTFSNLSNIAICCKYEKLKQVLLSGGFLRILHHIVKLNALVILQDKYS